MNPTKNESTEEVEVELKDDQIVELALMAHEKNITLNELISRILKEYISLVGKKEWMWKIRF